MLSPATWGKRFAVLLVFFSVSAVAKSDIYAVEYGFQFVPAKGQIQVAIILNNAQLVRSIDFNLKKSQCTDFRGDGKLTPQKRRLKWEPSGLKKAALHYSCTVNHRRKSQNRAQSYDAFMNEQWALFRGDDIVPPARVATKKGAIARTTLVFDMPKDWSGVNTGWERVIPAAGDNRLQKPTFVVDNPERNFDRPTGWMIAGKIGTRRAYLGPSVKSAQQIAVSAPLDSAMRRMDLLTFTQFVWPAFTKAFVTLPDKFLIVGGNDPLWRGGLSAGNSFFIHADRPIVSENGTSSLLHEMVHLVTRITGKSKYDWIAEGIAEYYAIELLQRAGGINQHRREQIMAKMQTRAKQVKTLLVPVSQGRTTAAAVLLFADLNKEILQVTRGRKNLDDVVRLLMQKRKVDGSDLAQAFQKVTGKNSTVLQSKLIQP